MAANLLIVVECCNICCCYQIGDDTNNTRKIATHKDEDLYIACKITLPVNQSVGDIQLKSIPFQQEFNKEDWIKCWRMKDGNVFVSKVFESIFHLEFID